MNEASLDVLPNQAYPLRASWDGEGANLAPFSEHAENVELCLLDTRSRRKITGIAVRWQTDQAWHCYLPKVRPG